MTENFIDKQQKDLFPTDTYFQDLDLYRSISEENKDIAKHFKEHPTWRKYSSILDLGAGDGRMFLELYDNDALANTVNKIHFVDIDPNRIDRVNMFLNDSPLKQVSKFTVGDISKLSKENYNTIDVALLIHVVYYLEDKQLKRVIENLPKNVPLFIVLDHPDSLFSSCWKYTAPKYLERTFAMTKLIESYNNQNNFKVQKTKIESLVKNPYLMNDEQEQENLLSFITYSSYKDLTISTKNKVASIFKAFENGKFLNIDCNCYCLVKN